MPFNIEVIHNSNDSRELLTIDGKVAVYISGMYAAQEVERRKAMFTTPIFAYRIVRVKDTGEESNQWKKREQGRFANGQYTAVPWQAESWASDGLHDCEHFVHMSMDKTGMVAYTESADKGRDDIQKRMRPGKYLTRYFATQITPKDIRRWAGKVSLLSGESQEYSLAKTPDEIEHVYTTGPNSCMGKSHNEYESPEHPVRMYGAGDLAVAYIERESSIAARCIVWPENKIWGRTYGDGGVYQEQLKELLQADGYKPAKGADCWKGARLLKVETPGGYVAPYLDIGGGTLTDCGEYLEISPYGEIDATSENGVTGDRTVCEGCGGGYDAENDGGSVGDYPYCQTCYEEIAVYCEDCDTTVHQDCTVYLENLERTVCDSCAGDYPVCDSCREQFNADDMRTVTATDESVCESCFDKDYAACADCDDSDRGENLKTDDSGDSLCENCFDVRVEEGDTSSARKPSATVKSENQSEMEV